MADAFIVCWDTKYHYVFWRPVTAIQECATDGNPATIADPAWTPLIVTPPFPEYTSGHSTTSSAGATVLANYFGENTELQIVSDGMPGVIRSFTCFAAALEEVADARVFGGIHFRAACDDGRLQGTTVANYVIAHAFQPVHGEHNGQAPR
jgi:membrane-associated phospholipid phosphatase